MKWEIAYGTGIMWQDFMTREQMAVVLYRLAQIMGWPA